MRDNSEYGLNRKQKCEAIKLHMPEYIKAYKLDSFNNDYSQCTIVFDHLGVKYNFIYNYSKDEVYFSAYGNIELPYIKSYERLIDWQNKCMSAINGCFGMYKSDNNLW